MGATITSYRDLLAWQKAFAVGLDVYRVTDMFPDRERFSLTQQMRRSAVSVPSNIAEGYGRGSRVEYLRYLKISRGSLCELETQMLFAIELKYASESTTNELLRSIEETKRILAGLIRSIERPAL
ncbi:MAG: four helix bundle protein [Phycisphaeraceae bacterium]|nr:four helix bundle protein [Phycisphaeraceae bacterium]